MSQASFSKVRAALLSLGFAERKVGSHAHFVHPDGAQVTVPNRLKLDEGTLRAVARQVSGFSVASETHFQSMLN
jgi:predicted RNA binding protein YcfA (HicA-like mRNA interferase family)